jgi:membrane-bound lytic murein transglycosylase A
VSRKLAAATALAAVLAGCTTTPRPRAVPPRPAPSGTPTPAPLATSAASAGLAPGPPVRALGITAPDAVRALGAFRASCPALLRRNANAGIEPVDWAKPCAQAATVSDEDALRFFETAFEAVQVGDGKAFATGYYEPEIAGSRTQAPGYDVPIYRRPPDLIEINLGAFASELKGKTLRGRIDGNVFVPYFDRAAIDNGALAGRGLELAWAADPVAFFFLQIQGSGRLRLADGQVMRIGYDSQNGRDYVGIGSVMRARGLLGPGQANMQGIVAWLRANPAEGRALMRENGSYVFFRELTGAGPLGALGIAVAPRGSVAADPRFVPLGAPVFLSLDRAEASGLWIAQDTGGAIKGANRFDTFWGAGDDAARIAGGMSARGQSWLLLPAGTLAAAKAPHAAAGR